MHKYLFVLVVLFLMACSDKSDSVKDTDQEIGEEIGLNPGIMARVPFLLSYPVDSTQFPRSMEPSGEIRGVPSKDWTSGFYPGSLIYLYQLTADDQFFYQAEKWLPFIEKEKYNDYTHDMGFKVYCSYGRAYEVDKNPHYKDVIVESAQTLSTRYSSKVGCIKSWSFGGEKWQFPVIIDNMMNLELLFEATNLTGDSSYYKIAESHAQKTLENHFRADNSSYHVIDYNNETGAVEQRLTHQGISNESVWSRGQAWGLYGFTMAYRYTKNPAFLEQANKIAQFIMTHPLLPEDKILYWDMSDPNIPNAERDASASAVIASACFELYGFTKNEAYLTFANDILSSLSSDYLLASTVDAPFILDHSTGNWPAKDEIDVPISYGDYFFLEALYRQSK